MGTQEPVTYQVDWYVSCFFFEWQQFFATNAESRTKSMSNKPLVLIFRIGIAAMEVEKYVETYLRTVGTLKMH